jgi:hypothetical protein
MSQIAEQDEFFEEVSNPLDGVEEILYANQWVFDRMTNDELTVQITGKMGEYKLFFQWQEEYSAMTFSCQYDLDIHRSAVDEARRMMSTINAGLWLGHFDLREGDIPCFRHTTLFRGMTQTSGVEPLEDLVDIALSECERFYPVFEILSRGLPANDDDLKLAAMSVAGMS